MDKYMQDPYKSPSSLVELSNVKLQKGSSFQQYQDNLLVQSVQKKGKDDTNVSIFHPMQTLKQRQNSRTLIGSNLQSSQTEYENEKSEVAFEQNFDKKQQMDKINFLSDYLDRDKTEQMKMLQNNDQNDTRKDIPFKAKYFLQDTASQILKETIEQKTIDKIDKKISNILNKAQSVITRTFMCIRLKEIFVDTAIDFWFNKLPFLYPYSTFKLAWEFWIAVLTCFIFFIFSLRIIFQQTNIGNIFDIYQLVFFILGIIFWTLDIFIELNTGILDRGELIEDKRYIQKRYLKKRFAFDALGIIPILQVLLHPNGENQYLDFFIILKIKHFLQTLSRIDYYLSYQQDKKNMMDLVKLIFLIVVTTHFIALLWYRLAVFEKDFLGYSVTWLDIPKINSQTFMDLYWQSFYFATVTMYTVGYGDITPVTIIEFNFVSLTILVTGIIFAYAINQIGLIMHNIKQAQTNLKEDLQILNKIFIEMPFQMKNEDQNTFFNHF